MTKRIEVGVEGLFDGDVKYLDAQALRKVAGILAAHLRTVLGRHEHADNILFADGGNGNSRNQG